MTTAEVARHLRLNQKKVYAMVAAGDIPAVRVSGKWLFPRALIDSWLEEHTDDYLIVQWYPAKPAAGGGSVRVRYKYFSGSRKAILTDRVFTIQGHRVVGVTQFE